MRKEKQIQIPELLWDQIIRFVLVPELRDKLEPEIKDGIQAKIDRQTEREYFSIYKTSRSRKQKDEALKKYMESKGIPYRPNTNEEKDPDF